MPETNQEIKLQQLHRQALALREIYTPALDEASSSQNNDVERNSADKQTTVSDKANQANPGIVPLEKPEQPAHTNGNGKTTEEQSLPNHVAELDALIVQTLNALHKTPVKSVPEKALVETQNEVTPDKGAPTTSDSSPATTPVPETKKLIAPITDRKISDANQIEKADENKEVSHHPSETQALAGNVTMLADASDELTHRTEDKAVPAQPGDVKDNDDQVNYSTAAKYDFADSQKSSHLTLPELDIPEPVHVAFRKEDEDQDFLVLSISSHQPIRALGSADWLDFRFTPYSQNLEAEVSFQENPEEWARALPEAYSASQIKVYLCPDPLVRRLNPSYKAPSPASIIRDPITSSTVRAQAAEREARAKAANKPKRGLFRK